MALMLGLFAITLMAGIPIAVCLGLTSLVMIFIQGFPPMVFAQKLFIAQQSSLLLAIPLFILAGELMRPAGIMEEMLKFINLLVGRFRGSLGYVNVLGSMVFSGTSGSAVADASATGGIMIPMISREYKDPSFAACLTGASSTVGPIIPPSIPMIFYALLGNVSVIGLFVAGVVPGLIIGIGLLVMSGIYSHRRKHPVTEVKTSFAELRRSFLRSLPILLMPIIVIGGIVGGIFTATEAAAIAVLYVFLAGFLLTRKLKISDLVPAFINTAVLMSVVFLILSTSTVVAFELTVLGIPDAVANWFLEFTSNKWVFLICATAFFLAIGMILEPIPAMIMLVPIFEPVAMTYGLHPIHFGFVVVLNLVIGLLTPPVGPTLYITGGIANVSIERMSKDILPWVGFLILVLLLTVFVPEVVLWLPGLMGYV
ncbi:TRAP transporter large permease [Oricola indica]|uniref:TRAP transporter large permease n=1 Tax=Oricola indica TaxID=2872591 RepID=UPI003CCC2CE1